MPDRKVTQMPSGSITDNGLGIVADSSSGQLSRISFHQMKDYFAVKPLNFIIGDGQSFTPSASSTVFTSSLIVNVSIINFSNEGIPIVPISRSFNSWYSYTGSIGRINLNNMSFNSGSYFQILYV